MSTLNAKNVRFARTGGLWSAPVGTALPTSNTDPIPATFQSWGYLGPDGIGEAISQTSEDVPAWQNGDIVGTVVTESTATYSVPAMETRKHIIEEVYGTVVNEVDGSYEIDPGAVKPRRLFIMEVVDTTTMKKMRKTFEGQVTEVGEINYTSTESIILTPTIKVFGKIKVVDDALIAETSGGETGGGETGGGENGWTGPSVSDMWNMYPNGPYQQAETFYDPSDQSHAGYDPLNDPTNPESSVYDNNWFWSNDPRYQYLMHMGLA